MTDYNLTGTVGPYHSYWPIVNITQPSTGPLGGLSVVIKCGASDGRYGTPAKVHYYYQYFAGPGWVTPGPYVYIGAGTNSTYDYTWTFPSCGDCPNDKFRILAFVEGANGRIVWHPAGVDLALTGRGC